MNVNKKSIIGIIAFLFLLQSASITVADEKAVIKKTVESIKKFDYGQAGKNLRELERLINKNHDAPDLRAYIEEQILSALQSKQTTLAAKKVFCQKLASIASDASLPVLSKMLVREETTEMACYALKNHPSPKVNRILRQALGKLQGTAKVAVIHLIGERHAANSIQTLSDLISGDDLNTAKAAVTALGNIGTEKCAEVIEKFRASNPDGLTFELADAFLQCALNLKKEGKIDPAVNILRELSQKREPAVIRRGARHNLLDLGLLDINFDEIQAEALFDGTSFNGWNGNLEFFRIEDGAIVAGNLKEQIPRNEFLCADREFANFELRLKCKLSAKEANAGIQIRSRRIPNNHEMRGYQADMGQHYWGCLYDESRRRVVLADSNKEELGKVLRPTGWNDYVIRCMGRRIQLWINGYQTVDYLEPDETIEQFGLIGLQIHAGPPAEAWYKDIEIRVFDFTQ